MEKYSVVGPGAARDPIEIVDYGAAHDSASKAFSVAADIEQGIATLESFLNRGAHPKALLGHGIRDFREICFKPYRILYRVVADKVVVVPIADGRRDMQALLTRRLLSD